MSVEQTRRKEGKSPISEWTCLKISREFSGTAPNLTLDDTAEYHADSDSGSDDDDPADGQLSD